MPQHLGAVTLLVRDYDEALDYYARILGFKVVEDVLLDDDKRWLMLAPPGAAETRLLLAKASTPEQVARVGDQAGGRVSMFLHTDDFWCDYQAMRGRGVRFLEEPRVEAYGTVAVFADLYGNRWDLIEPVR